MTGYTSTTALFSPCKLYRYTLERWWSGLYGARDYANFLMCNPSTADTETDDPTVRRAALFAKRWGYAGLIVTNIFAYRSTDPQKLYSDAFGYSVPHDIVGPENDTTIQEVAKDATLVVCAWGVHGKLLDRGKRVVEILKANSIPLYCLGVTKEGHPKHPLYTAAVTLPRRFE